MKPEHIKHLIPEYQESLLEEDQILEVKKHLEQCAECRNELEQFLELERQFLNEKEVEPSPNIKASFSAMLEREKAEIQEKRTSFPYKEILKIAAAIVVLFISFEAGRLMEQKSSNEPVVVLEDSGESEQRIAMLSLITNESASKRIQGVNYFEDFEDLDEDILKVLINKMLYDENKNVRLAAVEALAKFSTSEEVKDNLITALKTENDPVIQISLIQVLVKIQEKQAVEPMKNLLQKEETEPFVKDQIKALLPSIV
ncbi:HEAT repeat domain-containing protein [Antarcticibacterium sp. 1MA-6-2]|uniref:HEAT repeat domain-containing protein n=1 Tax=Antarcticibacterium sp. 1MA-6-2 TaxID=2908210 RepID=UPI001F409C7E|nr:HEAT repeat domain-containing protein [Antarcticibacterium sp. 1MA-6-2]UJH89842.1 HEAT repeat domain-containing protein [Antarcticibacterium sp. 1MA-6-2]